MIEVNKIKIKLSMIEIKAEEFAKLLKSDEETTLKGSFVILEMKNKLDNIEDQSWYFRKAADSKKSKLNDMVKQYNKIKNIVNEKSFGKIDKEIEDFEEDIENIKQMTGFGLAIFTNIIKLQYYYWKAIRAVKREIWEIAIFKKVIGNRIFEFRRE